VTNEVAHASLRRLDARLGRRHAREARRDAGADHRDHLHEKSRRVDQSTNEESATSLAALIAADRLRYVRTGTRGLSRARNIGLRLATTRIVAFTDDDCEVADDWIATMQRVFDEQPRTLIAFCNVHAGPYDATMGFIPTYVGAGTRVIRTVREKCSARGIGAGLAVRRAELLAIGGFDEELGAGGRFPAAEDGDAALRAILAGYEVCETDRTHVVHHGFRTWAEGKALASRDWVGIGAASAKPLRAGRWQAGSFAAHEFLVHALWPPVSDLLKLRRPVGFGRSIHFLRGFAMGLRVPVDARSLCFEPASGSDGPASPIGRGNVV
jgi:hypothetical protein